MSENSKSPDFAELAPIVLASGLVLGENPKAVCYVFRTEPNNEHDSGWNFWSGEEDEEYVDDLSNFTVCSLQDFLTQDPSINQILNAPIGTFWEREPGGDWSPIEIED